MRLQYAAVVTCLALSWGCASAPPLTTTAYGVEVVDRAEVLAEQVRDDPRKQLVDLTANPGLTFDIRYATQDNFMGEVLYDQARPRLRAGAAAALARASEILAGEGLAIKVYDAYRPYRITVRMWERIGNPDYVADPSKGSRHNRGCAVDLTLVRRADGSELAMPTPYDDFTERAHHDFVDLSSEVLANRARLRAVMEEVGFEALPTEWWHYDYRGWRDFELLDLP